MARQYPLDRVRNISIIAHIDAGKTTAIGLPLANLLIKKRDRDV